MLLKIQEAPALGLPDLEKPCESSVQETQGTVWHKSGWADQPEGSGYKVRPKRKTPKRKVNNGTALTTWTSHQIVTVLETKGNNWLAGGQVVG